MPQVFVFASIHTFTVGRCSISIMRGFRVELNPVFTSAESWSTIHLYIFLWSQSSVCGLLVSHQSVSLEVLLELCQLQTFFERMGGVPCSFTQECNTIGESALQMCAVFFHFCFSCIYYVAAWHFHGGPKTVCLPIIDSGSEYQGGEYIPQ